MRKSGKSFKETVNDTLRLGLVSRQKIKPLNLSKSKQKIWG